MTMIISLFKSSIYSAVTYYPPHPTFSDRCMDYIWMSSPPPVTTFETVFFARESLALDLFIASVFATLQWAIEYYHYINLALEWDDHLIIHYRDYDENY